MSSILVLAETFKIITTILNKINLKTVFFLGAGFCRDAGMPLQINLLKDIFELDTKLLNNKLEETFIISKKIVRKFLFKIGFRKGFSKNIELEDLFYI